MPKSLNRVCLLGYVGGDPETRSVNSGDLVANFSLATSESWTKDGEKHERTEWHRIVVWRKLAEIVQQYVKKGMRIYVEGKLQTRKWDKDGQTHYATEIVIDNLIMLGSAKDKEQDAGPSPDWLPERGAQTQTPAAAPTASDDLPF